MFFLSYTQFFSTDQTFFVKLMKNVIKNKNFWFLKKLYEIRKKCFGKNIPSQEDIKFTPNHFLIEQVVLV